MMPYGDANAIVMEMAREVLPVVSHTPVLAGVCGTDPFRIMKLFLKQVDEAGFSGVQNFPTVGLYDGTFRQGLEETGMGYGLEVDLIRQAREMNLLTTPYCFNPEESTAMAEAGADIIIAHMGLTTKGTIGATSAVTLDDSVRRVQAIHDAAKRVRKDVIVLCHGGPIAEPADAQYILDRTTGISGFYGASSMERLPVEPAIRDRVAEFTRLQFKPQHVSNPPKADKDQLGSDAFHWLDANMSESLAAPDEAFDWVFLLRPRDWQLLESVWEERSDVWREACAYIIGAGPVAPSQQLLRLALADKNIDVAAQAAISLCTQMLEHPDEAPFDPVLAPRLKELVRRDPSGNMKEVEEILRRYDAE
jgi:predicted TIM-barrel enzyme